MSKKLTKRNAKEFIKTIEKMHTFSGNRVHKCAFFRNNAKEFSRNLVKLHPAVLRDKSV